MELQADSWKKETILASQVLCHRESQLSYVYLAIAIVAEVVATSALKASQEFTRIGPSVLAVLGYGAAFYLMTLCLKTMSVGVVYAIWSGMGIVLIGLVAAVLYKEVPDLWGMVGMALIVAGVVVLNLLSNTTTH